MKHVLVVEDEPDAAELIEYHLKETGYKVTIAEDGNQALKKVHKLMPDLVILDLMIPEVAGVDVCRFIRKRPIYSVNPYYNVHSENKRNRQNTRA